MPLASRLSGGGRISRNAVHSFGFTTISSEKALYAAWKKFSVSKKSRIDVAEYQTHLKINISRLHVDLINGTYEHGKYRPFTICDPKTRKIHKATVRDRLVHQAVVSAIESLFEKRFIYDSYSCRVGKPFEETLRRHETKPNAHEFGEKLMREWWKEHDVLGMFNEAILHEAMSIDEIVGQIISDIQGMKSIR